MKAILISINPRYVKDILNGIKTIEIRKSMPKCDLPIDVYIYCTKDNKYANLINRGGFLTGMVVAKFTLNKVEKIRSYLEPEQWYMTNDLGGIGLLQKSCLSFKELDDYLLSGDGYAWHIDNLVRFENLRTLQPYFDMNRPPQSWCYFNV